MNNSLALDGGRHHFFDNRSFSIALSSMVSANSFFSRTLMAQPKQASPTHKSQSPDLAAPLQINLALQGGGSHGASRAAEETVRKAL
jgi:hypothetical protein